MQTEPQFEDAVTAFHNGELARKCGMSDDYVHAMRSGYLLGMTWGIEPQEKSDVLSMSDHYSGLFDGLSDARMDRLHPVPA